MLAAEANAFDVAIRSWMLAHQSPPVATFFAWVTVIGSVSPVKWFGVAAAALMAFQGRLKAALALLFAPLVAVGAYTGLKLLFRRARPVSVSHYMEDTYSFPSAHATTSAAVSGALAYVLWREGLLPAPFAVAFAIAVPLLVGASRVYLDAHWTTDVLGGWMFGLMIAGLSVAIYHYKRREVR